MLQRKKEIITQLQEILAEYKPATVVLPRNLPRKRQLSNPAAAARGKRAKNTGEIKYYWCSEDNDGPMVECSRGT